MNERTKKALDDIQKEIDILEGRYIRTASKRIDIEEALQNFNHENTEHNRKHITNLKNEEERHYQKIVGLSTAAKIIKDYATMAEEEFTNL